MIMSNKSWILAFLLLAAASFRFHVNGNNNNSHHHNNNHSNPDWEQPVEETDERQVAIAGIDLTSNQDEEIIIQHTTETPQTTSSTFTFASDSSFLKLDPTNLWSLTSSKYVSFKFRTTVAHGLLMYNTLTQVPFGFPFYQFYIMLDNSVLKIIHEFGNHFESFEVGHSLDDDRWHEFSLRLDPETGKLSALLDFMGKREFVLEALMLAPNYGVNDADLMMSTHTSGLLYFGGVDEKDKFAGKQMSGHTFVGCLKEIAFNENGGHYYGESEDSRFSVILQAQNLTDGCVDQCVAKQNPCQNNGFCINQYRNYVCDCSYSKFQGPLCSEAKPIEMTFKGSSYIKYKLYDWRERLHSHMRRATLHFRTKNMNGMLLHAFASQSKQAEYISLFLHRGQVMLKVAFGNGIIGDAAVTAPNGLNDDRWHNVTLIYGPDRVFRVQVDELEEVRVHSDGGDTDSHLHPDPYIYVGGLPDSTLSSFSIRSHSAYKFIGCLKLVSYNGLDVLYDLKHENPKALYSSPLPAVFECSSSPSADDLALTLGSNESFVVIWKANGALPWLDVETQRALGGGSGDYLRVQRETLQSSPDLKLAFEFRSTQEQFVVASGGFSAWDLTTKMNHRFHWFVQVSYDQVEMLSVHEGDPPTNVSSLGSFRKDQWNKLSIELKHSGKLIVSMNSENTQDFNLLGNEFHEASRDFVSNLELHSMIIGQLRPNYAGMPGLHGCVRELMFNEKPVDIRALVANKDQLSGRISLDECRLVDPCAAVGGPPVCEHGGRCYAKPNGEPVCDCTDTGYAGTSCHFTKYKRNCEELYLAGYRKSDVYMIDIDRNGPMKPARVDCKMDEKITTSIIHNLERETIIRKQGLGDFRLQLTYRDFTTAMLRKMISNSYICSQLVEYQCITRAPLHLGEYTWFRTAKRNHEKLTSLGSSRYGHCACSATEPSTCKDPSLACNCDDRSSRYHADVAKLNQATDVGITDVIVLQQPNLTEFSEGRLTIGPLDCINSRATQNVITFKTANSYVEVLKGITGDLAFSFRTTASSAILLYQSSVRPPHGHFKVALVNDYTIRFEYVVSGRPRSSEYTSTARRLNTGEWQQIWIDYDAHHMRFIVNLDPIMVDREPNQEFRMFEGPLYIGGMPRNLMNNNRNINKNVKEYPGYIGCFRGLTIGDEIIDFNQHLHHESQSIVSGCQPSCDGGPCQNGGKCVEKWGDYECKCSNPVAESGKNCEQSVNNDALTFRTRSSFVLHDKGGPLVDPNFLTENIMVAIRTHDKNSLIFYANDHLNNFVQLHIENGTNVVFTFNSFSEVVRGAVPVGPYLMSGKLNQIQILRSPLSTKVIVTGPGMKKQQESVVIQKSISLLMRYEQTPWKVGKALELVTPARPSYPVEPYSQMFIGGVGSQGASSQLDGLVGCLAGLKMGRVQLNLTKVMLKTKEKWSTDGVSAGCKPLCDAIPCDNNGVCIEDWQNEKTSCDCGRTSYTGEKCDQDIGSSWDGDSFLQFDASKETEGVIRTLEVHLAISTDGNHSVNQSILVMNHAYSDDYMLIGLNAAGSLVIRERHQNKVYERQVNIPEWSFTGRHWLHYTRTSERVSLIVDGEEYFSEMMPKVSSTDWQLMSEEGTDSPKQNQNVISVGGSRLSLGGYYSSFVGCISNVLVTINGVAIRPLEAAFDGSTRVTTYGNMKQSKCAPFLLKPTTGSKSTDEPTLEPPPIPGGVNWSMPAPEKLAYIKPEHSSSSSFKYMLPLIISITILVVVLTGAAIYMFRLQKRYQVQKFRGETPFFHKKPSNSDAAVPTKYAMVYNKRNSKGHDDEDAKAELLTKNPAPIEMQQRSKRLTTLSEESATDEEKAKIATDDQKG